MATKNNILTIQTVQIAPFRTLMTALKDILLETNITFTKEGIKIINMDKSHTILAHLSLEAKNFELYDCKMADYTDGIVQFLGLKFENGEIKQHKIQKLRLIEPDNEDLDVPDVKFSSVINLPSADFQKIIRDLSCISDKIEIKSVATTEGAELIFKCTGGFAHAEIHHHFLPGGVLLPNLL